MDLDLQKSYGFKEVKEKKESLIKKTYDTYEKPLMQKPCVGGIIIQYFHMMQIGAIQQAWSNAEIIRIIFK